MVTSNSSITGSNYSTMTMTLKLSRYKNYFEVTLFIPVIVLAVLSVAGLLLPASSGEKMGFQVTILLALVVYIEIIRDSVPIWANRGDVPIVIWLFIITVIVNAWCCLVTCLSLFMHFIDDDHLFNYNSVIAKLTRYIAIGYNWITGSIGWFPYTIPTIILLLSNAATDSQLNILDKDCQNVRNEYRKAWKFSAKMCDVVHVFIAFLCIFVAFCATIINLYFLSSTTND